MGDFSRFSCIAVTPMGSNDTDAFSSSRLDAICSGGHGIAKPEIRGIEAEIGRCLRSVRQIEATADELLTAHATNR